VLDRLLDVLVIDTLRSWYQQQADATSWWDAHHDPLVGAVLGLIHDSPEEAWTISSLARAIGTSRANLARRFNELVGEPPITYLTKWRLSLAADLLCQPQATVTNTARSVGYGSAFAFSTAFKRRYGVSPHQHRTRVLEAAARPA
jgi:transcriptional regulator GlxA family with amidase domain